MTRGRLPAFRPSVLHVALLVPWVGLILGVRRPVRDNSYLWHVTAGTLELESKSVLTADPFSFTRAGEAWRTQSWLGELLYARLDDWLGVQSVPLIMAVVMGLTIAVVMVTTLRVTKNVAAVAAMGALTIWAGSIYLNPRPVVFSYLLMALVVMALAVSRLRWTLPIIIWMWAMFHGSFVIGIGLVVLDALRREDWQRGVRWGAGLAAVAGFTAHGWAVWEMLIAFFRARPALALITEWAPPKLATLGQAPLFIGILLLMVAAARGKLTARDLWLVAPMLFLAFSASRSVFPAWLALAPLIATGVATDRLATFSPPGRLANAVLVPLLVIGPFMTRADAELDPLRFPLAAVDCVDPSRRLFHDDVVGGYLIYAHHPDIPVFVDDRAELYNEDLFRDVLEVRSGGQDASNVLDGYGISQALLPEDSPGVDDLVASGWATRFRDDAWVLLDSVSISPCR